MPASNKSTKASKFCLTACLFLIVLVACAKPPIKSTPEPVVPSCPPCEPYPTQLIESSQAENQSLTAALATAKERIAELETEISTQSIQVLLKAAVVEELKKQEMSLRERLEDAISEVVRTKAKLRSIDSKAEAASTIAEAEIAVTSAKAQIGAADPQHGKMVAAAERLLQHSTREFKANNYGGALYLALQSLGQVRSLNRHFRTENGIDPVVGETIFDPCLPLAVMKNTNLREGPGLSQKVITTLQSGTAIDAYSFKGDWIRVKAKNGDHGWVHQTLVTAP